MLVPALYGVLAFGLKPSGGMFSLSKRTIWDFLVGVDSSWCVDVPFRGAGCPPMALPWLPVDWRVRTFSLAAALLMG